MPVVRRSVWRPLKSAVEREQEDRIVQIDLSATFQSTHQGILFKLCSVGVGGSVLSVLTQFLSNQSQHVVVDGCRSKPFIVVAGVPQGSVLGPQLYVLPVHLGTFLRTGERSLRLC